MTSRERCSFALFIRSATIGTSFTIAAQSRLVLAQLEFRRNLHLLKEALTERTKDEHEREREILKLQQQLTRVLGLNIQ